MPPKQAKGAAPSKKADQKKKERVIEDKTFGLKNKKGAKTQKFIQQVEKQVKHGQQSARKVEELKKDPNKKEEKKKEAAMVNQLFRPVSQKVEKGIDPKSVLCAFFKQGQCTKGDKCKFSHDLNIERKAEKRSVYCDMRDEDNMDTWDEDKLKEVVAKKHAEADQKHPKTDIICKFFLEALEKSKYGWFWECPNGGNCHYRHALPPGFVLNKDKKKDDKKDEISIEDLVERERAALGITLTKVTLESFLAWKKRKQKEKVETYNKEETRKKAEFKAGRSVGLSGREMFTFKPEMALDDAMEDGEMAMDTSIYPKEEGEDGETNVRIVEFTTEYLASQATEVDGSGTVAAQKVAAASGDFNNHNAEESNKLSEASGGSAEPGPSLLSSPVEDVPIDEDLFAEDDEDLDELEENLESLDMDDDDEQR